MGTAVPETNPIKHTKRSANDTRLDANPPKFPKIHSAVAEEEAGRPDHENTKPGAVASLSDDTWNHVFSYIDRKELVHTVSLVCKKWYYTYSRYPGHWRELPLSIWNMWTDRGDPRKVFPTMKKFLDFLRRPQFAQLKGLALPCMDMPECGNPFVRILSCVPHLKVFSASFYGYKLCLAPRSNEVAMLHHYLPKVEFLAISLQNADRESFETMIAQMGSQLTDLHVVVSGKESQQFNDNTFHILAQHCPNLEQFSYDSKVRRSYSRSESRPSSAGPLALINGCRKLNIAEITLPMDVRRDLADQDIGPLLHDHPSFMKFNIPVPVGDIFAFLPEATLAEVEEGFEDALAEMEEGFEDALAEMEEELEEESED